MEELDQIQEVVDESQTHEESTTQEAKQGSPSKAELEARNFAALREKAVRAERERDEAMRRLHEIESKTQSPQDEEFTLGPDELAEGKHLSKVQKKIKSLEDQLKKYQQESTLTAVESKIRTKYPDFDNVVSKDNLSSLQNLYPELAQTILTSTDQYSQAASAYTLIKKLGIDTNAYEQDKQKVYENSIKPKPLASISAQQGSGALSKANAFASGLTKELQEQLLKEMTEARRGY